MITISLDPLGELKASYFDVLQHTGALLIMALAGERNESMRDKILDDYGYAAPIEGVTLDEQLRWHYPEDPTLCPAVVFHNNATGEKFALYPYALAAFIEPGKPTLFTRLD